MRSFCSGSKPMAGKWFFASNTSKCIQTPPVVSPSLPALGALGYTLPSCRCCETPTLGILCLYASIGMPTLVPGCRCCETRPWGFFACMPAVQASPQSSGMELDAFPPLGFPPPLHPFSDQQPLPFRQDDPLWCILLTTYPWRPGSNSCSFSSTPCNPGPWTSPNRGPWLRSRMRASFGPGTGASFRSWGIWGPPACLPKPWLPGSSTDEAGAVLPEVPGETSCQEDGGTSSPTDNAESRCPKEEAALYSRGPSFSNQLPGGFRPVEPCLESSNRHWLLQKGIFFGRACLRIWYEGCCLGWKVGFILSFFCSYKGLMPLTQEKAAQLLTPMALLLASWVLCQVMKVGRKFASQRQQPLRMHGGSLQLPGNTKTTAMADSWLWPLGYLMVEVRL